MQLALTAAGALALLATFGLGFASGCATPTVGLVDGRLQPCPGTPNCVSSDAQPPSTEALAFEGDADAAWSDLLVFLEAEPRVELVTVEPGYVHAVFRTRVLRFADDVEFRLDRSGSAIAVRSASRLGYSDMGANAKRVEDLRARWRADPGPVPSTATAD